MLKKVILFAFIITLNILVLGAQDTIPTEKEFFQIIKEKGMSQAFKIYEEARKKNPKVVVFRERALNVIGYQYLNNEKHQEAIKIFKLNVRAYPQAFNTYDSLAEAYMRTGNKPLAIQNYNKSVTLNPENVNGARFAYILANYTKKELLIPMRDGKKLFTQIYSPAKPKGQYPILLKRTPYSIRPYGNHVYAPVLGPNDLYAREGFIFVYQDVRGKFKSEGIFEVMKPHNPKKQDAKDVDESSDTYDAIAWLIKNLPHNNGRVGQWGISYPGWQTVMGMIDAHPALKASSPQASPADMWIGDDFHHNGAFRLMYTFGWLSNNARTRKGLGTNRSGRFDYGTPDGYKFFLELGTVANVDKKYFFKAVPTWNQYMNHGNYDKYWQRQDVLQYLNNINHPVLNVAGWFDAEDFYGPMSIYYTIEKKNPKNKSTLVVGPWLHGGWARMPGDMLGNIRFKEKTGEYFREKVEFPFFLSHLKGKGKANLPEAIVFETGSNQWRSYHQWPPASTIIKHLYLHANGKLKFSPPSKGQKNLQDSYLSDPRKPVPWSTEIRTSQGHLWMIEDQRFASRRPDVLVYQTDILTEDVTISGPIIADLFVSTTGTDADWIVKLIDVYPGNAPNHGNVRMGDFQMLLAGEVFRAKYRQSFQKPEPMVPGKITEIKFDLRDKAHCFKKGHRIMVQIQSTWFPVIDRNPQIFCDIYHAEEKDFQVATHTLHRSPDSPSHLKLRIIYHK